MNGSNGNKSGSESIHGNQSFFICESVDSIGMKWGRKRKGNEREYSLGVIYGREKRGGIKSSFI